MTTATIPQALSLFNALSHAGKVDTIAALYGGTPSFDVASKSGEELDFIVAAWVNSSAIPAGALALACATTVAATQTLLAVAPPPQAPAPPVAAVPGTVATIPAAVAPAPMPSPSGIAPQSVAPVAQPVTTPLAAAIVTTPQPVAFDAAAMPRQRSRVHARSLFPDCPADVRDAIPDGLTVEYYADPSAPPVDPDYAFDGRVLAASLGALACTPALNLWYYGPRGTGKTEFARQLAARTGRPFFRFNFTRSTDAEDILGGQGLRNGETVSVPGPVAIGATTPGAIVLLDEPTYCAPAHVAALNPILERNGSPVRIPRTGETLRVAEGVCFICADNTSGSGATSNEYMGRNPFGSDTLDRLQKFIAFDYLPPDVERKVLRALVKRACGVKPDNALARSVCKLVAVARAKSDAGELEGAPSLRRAVAFCVSLVQGFDPAQAYTDCIINAAPMDFHEALRQIFAATWDHGVTPATPAADANPFAVDDNNSTA